MRKLLKALGAPFVLLKNICAAIVVLIIVLLMATCGKRV